MAQFTETTTYEVHCPHCNGDEMKKAGEAPRQSNGPKVRWVVRQVLRQPGSLPESRSRQRRGGRRGRRRAARPVIAYR